MKINYVLENISELTERIFEQSNYRKIWAFTGEMGSGKTTLIKAICKNLEVTDEVSSPTFSLVNEYHTQNGEIIYHFDFYRIKTIEEVFDIGYEEYFSSGNLSLIEWSEKIEELLIHENVFRIHITKLEDETREISFV